MKAKIGISMLLETYGVRERIKCKLVGWSRDEYVVLKAPLTPGIRDRVTDGSQMEIRYLHEGELIGFRAEYIDFLVRPFPMLFVSYPMKTAKHTLRGKQRMECNLLGTLSVGGHPYRGVILDISHGGCKFLFDPGLERRPSLHKGMVVDGYFHTLGNPEPHVIRGNVVSLERYKTHGEVSLRFDTDANPLPEDLAMYLEEVSEVLMRLKP